MVSSFLNQMKALDATRKIDSLGRIVIPKDLRDKFHLIEGKAYQFFLHEEGNCKYLCLQCPDVDEEDEITRARKLLEEAGFTIINPGASSK